MSPLQRKSKNKEDRKHSVAPHGAMRIHAMRMNFMFFSIMIHDEIVIVEERTH
jgi:hypothetical protein